MFPAVQEGMKPSAVSTQTSQRPAEPDSVTTDGHMHQSEAPGEVGGAGDAQADSTSRANLRRGVLKAKHNYKRR